MMADGTQGSWYHDDLRRFVDALRYTEAATGFSARLIEKDYFCSLVLHDLLAMFEQGLIFKGGTCLSKVHAEFFRLSEDLDFSVSIRSDASRGDRRRVSTPFRVHLDGLPQRHSLFALDELLGHNSGRQYNGRFAYRSAVTGDVEHIKVEISLREENLLPVEFFTARTLLRDPHSGGPMVPAVKVRALHLNEAYAEKVRAALTRPEPAIRDFFDIDHALRGGLFNLGEQAMVELVAAKLAVSGVDGVDLGENRIAILRSQLATELRPVLRTVDFDAFNLDAVILALKAVLPR